MISLFVFFACISKATEITSVGKPEPVKLLRAEVNIQAECTPKSENPRYIFSCSRLDVIMAIKHHFAHVLSITPLDEVSRVAFDLESGDTLKPKLRFAVTYLE